MPQVKRPILSLYWNRSTFLAGMGFPTIRSCDILYFRITQAENNAEIRLGAKKWNLMS